MIRNLAALTLVALFAASACNKPPATPSSSDEPASTEESALSEDEPAVPEQAQTEPLKAPKAEAGDDFAGRVNPETILEKDRSWKAAFQKASPDADAAAKLAEVDPGAEVVVYLGVWCSDSRREVPRFWKALEMAGEVPFEVRHVGVDRSFEAGEVSLEGVDLQAVPTFVVSRDGQEVGRVVETSPNGIEHDVLALLSGEKSGLISASR
jgi:thiol-disulfide isomerase/thioredoxin